MYVASSYFVQIMPLWAKNGRGLHPVNFVKIINGKFSIYVKSSMKLLIYQNVWTKGGSYVIHLHKRSFSSERPRVEGPHVFQHYTLQ